MHSPGRAVNSYACVIERKQGVRHRSQTGRVKFALPVLAYSGSDVELIPVRVIHNTDNLHACAQSQTIAPRVNLKASPPATGPPYLPLPLQLLNLNEPIRVAQLKLPVVA